MKIICAPDSFKESLPAVAAANAMAAGIREVTANIEIDRCPVGDGGEGTLESLLQSLPGKRESAEAANVFGGRLTAEFGLLDNGRTAWVEAAAAIGLGTVAPPDRDVMRSSSFGVGEIIVAALRSNAKTIIVGVGGSASNDGGCGMAQALGVRFFDGSGRHIEKPISGHMLTEIHRIDTSDAAVRLQGAQIIAACDVRNPLTGRLGAAQVFAAQKGATAGEITQLDDGLRNVAEVSRRDLGMDIEFTAGAGAAGGLGGGLIAFAGAEVVSGIETVLDALHFADRVQDASLCLTGEGCLDEQSLSGKACIGVATIAAKQDVRTIALVGRAGPGAAQSLQAGIAEYVVIGEGLSNEESMRQTASLLSIAAGAITRKYC